MKFLFLLLVACTQPPPVMDNKTYFVECYSDWLCKEKALLYCNDYDIIKVEHENELRQWIVRCK